MQMAEKHHSDWNQSVAVRLRPWIRRGSPILLLAVIVVGFFWKLVLTNQFTWLASNDLSSMVLPWFQFQASEWHAGRFPLWDPYSWAGQPLLAQAQPGAAYPLNWLLFLAPLKHSWIRQSALHWYYVVVRILAAICFYALCRDLGRSRRASVVAGTTYGIAGYLGSVEWPQMVNGAVWAPLMFLFQFRAMSGSSPFRNTVYSGFFLGLTWLCGHHQLPLLVSLSSVCLWIYFIWTSPRRTVAAARHASFALGVCVFVGALQTLPTFEYGRLAQRWASTDRALHWNETVPYAIHEDHSFKPLSMLSIVVPGLDVNEDPLIGAVAFTLVVLGVAAAWYDVRVRWLAAIAAAGVVFALGPNSVYHGLLYAVVPMLEKARVPAHGMFLFHLGACALLAYGIDLFPSLSRRFLAAVALAMAAVGFFLSATAVVLFETKVLTVQGDSRFVVTAVACVAGATILWTAWRETLAPKFAAALLLSLILLEVGNTSGYFFANYDRQKDRTANLRHMAEDSDLIEFLRHQPGQPFRIEYDESAIAHNIGDWWGLETFTSYVASAPDIVLRNDPYHARVQALLGVRYYVGTKPLRSDQTEVLVGATGHRVFRNAAAFPRAWTVHETRRVAVGDTGRLLTDPGVDLRQIGIVTRPAAALESCSGDQVDIAQHLPNRVVLDAVMQCRGLVVLSETWFPGWHAAVDGRPADLYDADGFLRAVAVDRGHHTITMMYRPASVIAGAAMTMAGSMFALGVLLHSRRRSM
jgi:hypothetical protein